MASSSALGQLNLIVCNQMPGLDIVADPVRLAVARHLGGGAASAAEVARAVGIHLNTARAHLGKLVDAGVVARENQPTGRRGRPVVRYRLESDWTPAGDDLLGLAQLMATALGGTRARMRERARRWGTRSANAAPESVRADVRGMLRWLGFEARVEPDELTLTNCPCPLASPDRPALVCGLVDAAIDGALQDGGLVARARRHDPIARRCRMGLAPA